MQIYSFHSFFIKIQQPLEINTSMDEYRRRVYVISGRIISIVDVVHRMSSQYGGG